MGNNSARPQITSELERYFVRADDAGEAKSEWEGECAYNCGVLVFVKDGNYWIGRKTPEAINALKNSGFDYTGSSHINVPHSGEDREKWFKANFDNRYAKYTNLTTLVETLIEQGVGEEEATILTNHFEGIVKAEKVQEKTKNVVYKVRTKAGKRLAVKLVRDEQEAEIEALVNYEFSRDSVLKSYVAKSDLRAPIKITYGDENCYLLIQEDLSEKARAYLGSRSKEWLHYWVKVLARVHVRGTEIMDQLGNYTPAQKLHREKDLARVETVYGSGEVKKIEELAAERIENENDFIHSDCAHNRLGPFLIDWGNSGRGSPYLDLARVFVDVNVQKNNSSILTIEEKKELLREYLQERNRLASCSKTGRNKDVDNSELSNKELEAAYLQYSKIEYMMNLALGSYYRLGKSSSGSGSCPDHLTADLMEHLVVSPSVEKERVFRLPYISN